MPITRPPETVARRKLFTRPGCWLCEDSLCDQCDSFYQYQKARREGRKHRERLERMARGYGATDADIARIRLAETEYLWRRPGSPTMTELADYRRDCAEAAEACRRFSSPPAPPINWTVIFSLVSFSALAISYWIVACGWNACP